MRQSDGERSRSDCVHEQVAKRIANVRFTQNHNSHRKCNFLMVVCKYYHEAMEGKK